MNALSAFFQSDSESPVDQLPDEVLDRVPQDILDGLRDGTLDEIPGEFIEDLPNDIIDALPEELKTFIPDSLLAGGASTTFVIVMGAIAALSVLGFLWGVAKSAMKAALFFALVAVVAGVVLFAR